MVAGAPSAPFTQTGAGAHTLNAFFFNGESPTLRLPWHTPTTATHGRLSQVHGTLGPTAAHNREMSMNLPESKTKQNEKKKTCQGAFRF